MGKAGHTAIRKNLIMVPRQPDTCSEIAVSHDNYLIFGIYPFTPYQLPITNLNSGATTLIFNYTGLFLFWCGQNQIGKSIEMGHISFSAVRLLDCLPLRCGLWIESGIRGHSFDPMPGLAKDGSGIGKIIF
jgi:hypothetical protein